MKKRAAFTLIELLVVVAIIGLLVGILTPSLSKARGQAKRVTCASQLHQVGIAMMGYLQDNRDRMPFVSLLPSFSPAPLDLDKPAVWFADVLKPHLKGQMSALECPNDTPGFTERPAPYTGRSFFQSERCSYQYRIRLAGLTPTEFGLHNGGFWHQQHHAHRDSNDTKVPPATIWFACDYDNFHGKADEKGARRYVYIDAHVSEFEN
jgi:prepilin-type N-terminal cleavage/methylation domain-containing protein